MPRNCNIILSFRFIQILHPCDQLQGMRRDGLSRILSRVDKIFDQNAGDDLGSQTGLKSQTLHATGVDFGAEL